MMTKTKISFRKIQIGISKVFCGKEDFEVFTEVSQLAVGFCRNVNRLGFFKKFFQFFAYFFHF